MLDESQAMLDLRVEGSNDWILALQLVAWAEIELGHVERAVQRCDELMEAGRRHVWFLGRYESLKLYQFLLHSLDEPEPAAILDGQLKNRWFVPGFGRSERDVDGWLDRSMPPDRRNELAARGATMTPAELHANAREAALRHLE